MVLLITAGRPKFELPHGVTIDDVFSTSYSSKYAGKETKPYLLSSMQFPVKRDNTSIASLYKMPDLEDRSSTSVTKGLYFDNKSVSYSDLSSKLKNEKSYAQKEFEGIVYSKVSSTNKSYM